MINKEELRIGLLFSHSGVTSYVEKTQNKAARLAIMEIEETRAIYPCKIHVVDRDTCSSPQIAAKQAEIMLYEDGVDVIIGCYMSSTRQAIVSSVERSGKLLVYPSPYEGFEYSNNVIYGGAVPNQHIMMLVRYLAQINKKTFYCIGSRYIFPIESNRVLMAAVAEQGCQVVREKYVELIANQRDFLEIICDVKNLKPDVIFLTVVGQSLASICHLMAEAGIPQTTQIVSLTVTEAEVKLIGPRTLKNYITAATYFQSCRGEENISFLKRYAEVYGSSDEVNCMAETAYAVTKITLSAIAEAGSVVPDAVMETMAGRTYCAPQGRITFDRETNHFSLWPRVAQINKGGRFEILYGTKQSVKPDPYLVQHSVSDDHSDAAGFLTSGTG